MMDLLDLCFMVERTMIYITTRMRRESINIENKIEKTAKCLGWYIGKYLGHPAKSWLACIAFIIVFPIFIIGKTSEKCTDMIIAITWKIDCVTYVVTDGVISLAYYLVDHNLATLEVFRLGREQNKKY